MTAFQKQYASDFDPHKAAQAAAFLLHKAGGTLEVIKLVKLLYLAERASLLQFGEPLMGDRLVSMQHGPVVSIAYDQMKGAGNPPAQAIWDSWMDARAGNQIALRSEKNKLLLMNDLLALSDSDEAVLQQVWLQYGAMDAWALRDLTHTAAVPEWQDPNGSSLPIDYETLFETNGKSKSQAKAIIHRLREQTAAAHAFKAAA
jgi:uncharacterized phage-associated protein